MHETKKIRTLIVGMGNISRGLDSVLPLAEEVTAWTS